MHPLSLSQPILQVDSTTESAPTSYSTNIDLPPSIGRVVTADFLAAQQAEVDGAVRAATSRQSHKMHEASAQSSNVLVLFVLSSSTLVVEQQH